MKPPTKENPAGGGQSGKKPLEDLDIFEGF